MSGIVLHGQDKLHHPLRVVPVEDTVLLPICRASAIQFFQIGRVFGLVDRWSDVVEGIHLLDECVAIVELRHPHQIVDSLGQHGNRQGQRGDHRGRL